MKTAAIAARQPESPVPDKVRTNADHLSRPAHCRSIGELSKSQVPVSRRSTMLLCRQSGRLSPLLHSRTSRQSSAGDQRRDVDCPGSDGNTPNRDWSGAGQRKVWQRPSVFQHQKPGALLQQIEDLRRRKEEKPGSTKHQSHAECRQWVSGRQSDDSSAIEEWEQETQPPVQQRYKSQR